MIAPKIVLANPGTVLRLMDVLLVLGMESFLETVEIAKQISTVLPQMKKEW